MINQRFRCNRQNGCTFHPKYFKWTKWLHYFSGLIPCFKYVIYFWLIRLDGNGLCWRATYQGHAWWPAEMSKKRSSFSDLFRGLYAFKNSSIIFFSRKNKSAFFIHNLWFASKLSNTSYTESFINHFVYYAWKYEVPNNYTWSLIPLF